MNQFLYYPVKDPINKSNPFGASSEMYTKLRLKGHQGIDFNSLSGTKLYAPCDGLAKYVSDEYGGDGLWIYNTSDGENNIIILYHLYPKNTPQFPFQVPTDGNKTLVKAGQFLAYTDNSGVPQESTGPHLHVGVIPCDSDWNRLYPNNGYRGCVDPYPYFNGLFAEDMEIAIETVEKSKEIISLIPKANLPPALFVSILRKVASLLNSLIKL